MKHLGNVSSEGGPFLIADARALRGWRGAADDARDYKDVCRALDAAGPSWGIPWRVDDLAAAIWEAEGEGTADVFGGDDGGLVLVRGWFSAEVREGWVAAAREAASKPRDSKIVGDIETPSLVVAVLWTPEDGRCIREEDLSGSSNRPSGGLAIDGSSMLVRVAHTRFRWCVDRTKVPEGEAIRCFVEPV